jgi:hypothetical protein
LTVIFWLTTFALLADGAKWLNLLNSYIEEENAAQQELFDTPGYNCTVSTSTIGDTPGLPNIPGVTTCTPIDYSKELSAVKAARAALGLSVITWLLFLLTFIIFGEHHFLDQK